MLLLKLAGGGVSKGAVDLEEAADLALPEPMSTVTFAGALNEFGICLFRSVMTEIAVLWVLRPQAPQCRPFRDGNRFFFHLISEGPKASPDHGWEPIPL